MGGKCQRGQRKQQDRAQCFPLLCGWLRPSTCIRKLSHPCASCPAPQAEPAPGSEDMDTHGLVLDNLCQSSAQPGAQPTETLGCPLWGTQSHGHSTHTPVPCPQPCWLPALQRLCLPLHAGCVSMFVFLRRCPSAAFQSPSRGTTSLEGPAALPDVSQARPWDSFDATKPAGTTASRA